MPMAPSVRPLTLVVNPLTAVLCKVPDMAKELLKDRALRARIQAGFDDPGKAAKAIGCSRTLVVSWEDGSAKSIGGKYLLKAARAYMVRPEWLGDGEGTDSWPYLGKAATVNANGEFVPVRAYALAAGGPIVHPAVPLLLICPICAHSLTQRPFIVGPNEVIEVHADWEGDEVAPGELEAMLTVDGQVGVVLQPGDVVRVRRSEHKARLLRRPSEIFYDRLRQKMSWE